ncbi:MAG: Crp/Fnr family transcriptional regulator [Blastocatellia bacterium]
MDNQTFQRRSRTLLTNRLLAVLPSPEQSELLARLELVELVPGQVLSEPWEPITEVYFPLDAIVSLLSVTADGEVVEIGMIGSEGLVGAAALLGWPELPYRTMVHGPGRAGRIELSVLESLTIRYPLMQRLLLRYLHTLLTQIAQTAVCNRFHSTQQRLANWLLASQDRRQAASFPWSRHFLAHLLGADHVSVNQAVSELKKAGLIRQARGQLTILNRDGLLERSCECYRIIKAEFDRFSTPG